MQTLGQRIVELIGKGRVVTSSSTPLNEEDISNFIKDGIRDFTAKAIASQNPNILSMLSVSKSDTTGLGINIDNGYVLSVVRNEAAASTTLNPATPIDASLRGRAADVNSLYYQSHYNPAYYILDGRIHILPTPSSSTDYGRVSYVSSEEAVDNSNYHTITIPSFPETFNGLIVYYGAAMACLAYASGIHTDMEDNLSLPSAPLSPFDITIPTVAGEITLPSVPVFSAPTLTYDLTSVNTQIANEDMELIEKELDKVDKNINKFDKDLEIADKEYSKQLDEFNKEFERRLTNNERKIDAEFTTFRENVNKYEKQVVNYQAELASYTSEMKEYAAKYQWFIERYQLLYNQYLAGVTQRPPAQNQAEA
tara:strand:- start:1582 stop:2679 length:1098 start_codon:yes stop_codon:yes gene_type:complete